jgi:antitoxin component YwqK of YwqJK toxin-antitoxin module
MRDSIRTIIWIFLIIPIIVPGCDSHNPTISSDGRTYELYQNDAPRKAYQVNPEGNPTGWVTEWNQDGSLKSDYFLNASGQKDGPYREWNTEGKLSRTGNYYEGNKVDTWSEYIYVNGNGQKKRYDTLFIGGQRVRYRKLLWAVISPHGLGAEYTTEKINDSVEVAYKASWYNTGTPSGFYFKEDQDGFSFRNGYDYEGKRLFFENTCNSVETIKDF